jgi:hypothetical protein
VKRVTGILLNCQLILVEDLKILPVQKLLFTLSICIVCNKKLLVKVHVILFYLVDQIRRDVFVNVETLVFLIVPEVMVIVGI